MAGVRLVLHGETRDHEGHAALVKRMQAFIATYEPETLLWECFGDPLTGRVLWHEQYASPDAFLFHQRNLDEQGFLEEFIRITRIRSISSLAPIDDDRVWAELRSFHADFLHGLGGVVR